MAARGWTVETTSATWKVQEVRKQWTLILLLQIVDIKVGVREVVAVSEMATQCHSPSQQSWLRHEPLTRETANTCGDQMEEEYLEYSFTDKKKKIWEACIGVVAPVCSCGSALIRRLGSRQHLSLEEDPGAELRSDTMRSNIKKNTGFKPIWALR